MPNWSFNHLILEGSLSNLELFYQENKDSKSDLTFNKSVKRPQEQNSNWYDWNYQNWGTKWDTRDVFFSKKKIIDNENILNTLLVFNRKLERKILPVVPIIQEFFTNYKYYYEFNTAWSPPFPWLEKIALKYNSIKFTIEYNVEGFDEGGRVIIKGNDLISQEKWRETDKIYESNKDNIDSIIKDYLKINNIIISNLSAEQKTNLYNNLLDSLYEEDFYIGIDQLENYFVNNQE